MPLARRTCALVCTVVLTSTGLVLSPSAGAAPSTRVPASHHRESPQVALDWELSSFRTVYTDGLTPIPVGVPVLGFTSVAMNNANRMSRHLHRSSETAAVATAAHDVLLHYYPTAAPALDADLATSLGPVPEGRARANGIRVGRRAAVRMLASRVGDGYLDPDIHYSKDPGPGVWQPIPPNPDMVAAWLGSLRPLVTRHPVAWGKKPYPLDSRAYARDFNEVRRLGRVDSTVRTDAQTATAQFYNSNSATMVGEALIRRLGDHPIGLRATTRIFAAMHAAMTNSVIRTWQLKRDVGFWRPEQAIALADTDGNPRTRVETGWAPLVPTPNYSEYVSGHASLTAPAIEVIRRTLGERTPLELVSVNSPDPRLYTRLSAIERDAFNARIWSGLHFRKAMTDGYEIGHRSARQVLAALR
ncbi:vanadium-dependent haloperoxidase [Nocardioides sp. MAHUQ-72]|uniref:vanadium-dependent haloperoxidase n=1 Tax=unclassified Nocardioides TaxID=2615069 RepID=UPI0036230377